MIVIINEKHYLQ